MSDANRLVRPRVVVAWSIAQNGHARVLLSCSMRLGCVLKMHGVTSSSGALRTGMSLERLERCVPTESGSRAVLRGGVGGLTARTYPVCKNECYDAG